MEKHKKAFNKHKITISLREELTWIENEINFPSM